MPLLLIMFFLFSFPQENAVYDCRNGTIRFASEAPLELIEASSKQLKGIIRVKDQGFAFSVDNQSFDGFNSPLQKEHFNENYMESKLYKICSFKGKIIEQVDFTRNDKYQVRAKGILNVHGVDQERIIKADLQVENGKIKVYSKFSVLLEDHKITIPKIVYQKIAEEIDLEVNATLTLK